MHPLPSVMCFFSSKAKFDLAKTVPKGRHWWYIPSWTYSSSFVMKVVPNTGGTPLDPLTSYSNYSVTHSLCSLLVFWQLQSQNPLNPLSKGTLWPDFQICQTSPNLSLKSVSPADNSALLKMRISIFVFLTYPDTHSNVPLSCTHGYFCLMNNPCFVSTGKNWNIK